MKSRISIVGVIGSGTLPYQDRSDRLGHWLAKRGVHLLTGGGGGVMAAVSKAFYETQGRRGSVIGIIPYQEDSVDPKSGYPNQWVEIPIYTHLPLSGSRGAEPLSRNHINILSSDVIVALPGGPGTTSEVILAESYQRPIVAFLKSFDEIRGLSSLIQVTSDFDEVCKFIESCLNN